MNLATLKQTLDDAIAHRDYLRPEYRRAINPRYDFGADNASRIEQDYQAASEAVKSARKAFNAARKSTANA